MNWAEIAIKTTTEGIEIVNGFLMAHGVSSVMIEDAADFQNFLEDTTIYWDYVDDKLMEMAHCDTRIKFYLPDTPQGHETLAQIQTDLARLQQDCDINLGELTVEIGYKEQEEWETAWQKYYHPIEISDRLVIVPDWEKAEFKEGQKQLRLNPGMAFGTGDHNTTRLCLQVLDSQMPEGVSVLDMGCGSGILSIAALMLGAKHVTAVDIDQLATKIARENAELNHIPEEQLEIMDPKTNIQIGCWYLSWLFEKFHGNLQTALAGYNAGHNRVAQWLADEEKSKDGLTLDEIPYEETEQYVGKVKIMKRLLL